MVWWCKPQDLKLLMIFFDYSCQHLIGKDNISIWEHSFVASSASQKFASLTSWPPAKTVFSQQNQPGFSSAPRCSCRKLESEVSESWPNFAYPLLPRHCGEVP